MLVRVQLMPFPFDLVRAECGVYPRAEVVWVQEEHKNMGYWTYVQPRIDAALRKESAGRHVKCVCTDCITL